MENWQSLWFFLVVKQFFSLYNSNCLLRIILEQIERPQPLAVNSDMRKCLNKGGGVVDVCQVMPTRLDSSANKPDDSSVSHQATDPLVPGISGAVTASLSSHFHCFIADTSLHYVNSDVHPKYKLVWLI